MQQTDQPNILSPTSVGETTAAPLLYAQAAASSSIAPPGVDALMHKVPTAMGERKRRMVTEEEREQLHAADSLVELALIFDTSAGKKGAFGGLGDARESTERTITDIIQATVPNVKIEQARIDSINVFANPSFYIVILVSRDDAEKTLGPQAELHQAIDFYLYGADGQKTAKRSDVAIIITTPDHVPNLALFADRPDKSTPAGGLNPGIAIVMYLQDTREIRIQTPTVRAWLMDDVLEDVNKVLETTRLQPRAGFKIQAILGQPARLAPRTPGGTGIGISIKFWLIPPPDLDPRDPESIKGVVLPAPVLLPRRYVEDPQSGEWLPDWLHDPDPTVSTRQLTRAERCQGGLNGQGDGVSARYIVSGGARIGGTLLEAAHDGERFFRLGDDYDPESNGIEGLQTLNTSHKQGDTARRIAQRKNAAQRAQRAAAAKLDPEAMTAHTAALAKSFLPAGVCRKAVERLSATDSPCYIPAVHAEQAADALDTPAQYITSACKNSSCRTAMCTSFNKTGEAVVNSLSETRAKAAASIAAARMEGQVQSQVDSFRPARAADQYGAGAEAPTLYLSLSPVSRKPPPARALVKAKAPAKAREKAPEKAPEKELEKAKVKHQYRRPCSLLTAATLPMGRASSDMSLLLHARSAVTTPMELDRSRENNSTNFTTDPFVNGPSQFRSTPRSPQGTWRHQQRCQRRDRRTLCSGRLRQPRAMGRLSRTPKQRVRTSPRHILRATCLPPRQRASGFRSTDLSFPTPRWHQQPTASSMDGTARCQFRALCLLAR